MTLLKWILIAIFICGISGEPVPKTFGKENSEESSQHESLPVSASWNSARLNLNRSDKAEADPGPLIFSDKRGPRVVLSYDRRTVTRVIIPNDESPGSCLAYTARPLMEDELFEITIEEITTFDYYLTFGLVATNPEKIPQLPIIPSLINAKFWYLMGTTGGSKDGKLGFDLPRKGQVGDSLGVVKTSSGQITFYFNKEILGSVLSSEENLYGVADLQWFGKLTITS